MTTINDIPRSRYLSPFTVQHNALICSGEEKISKSLLFVIYSNSPTMGKHKDVQ